MPETSKFPGAWLSFIHGSAWRNDHPRQSTFSPKVRYRLEFTGIVQGARKERCHAGLICRFGPQSCVAVLTTSCSTLTPVSHLECE